jgi:type I restriction enzyme, S subunit
MTVLENERSYSRHDAVVFHKTREQWGELSNMASGFPLIVCGRVWPSAEALYQACRFPDLPDVQQLIAEQTSGMAAKMKSKPHRSATREDWPRIRVRVMRWVLRVKLAQHMNRFGRVLLATGDAPIVERSAKDRYWGAIESADGTLEGQNVLGRLLMELRQELTTKKTRDELSVVTPPRVDHFILVGKPVGVVRFDDVPERDAVLY